MLAKLKEHSRHLYLLGLILGGALFIGQVSQVLTAMMRRPLELHRPWLLGLSFGAALIATVFQIAGWRAIMAQLGCSLRWRASWPAYTIPFVARYIPGVIWGYLGRSHLLQTRYGVSPAVTNLSAIIEAGGFVAASSFVAASAALVTGDTSLFGLGVAGCCLAILGVWVARWLARHEAFWDRWLSLVGGGSLFQGVTLIRVLIAASWHLGLWISFGVVLWSITGMLGEWRVVDLPVAMAVYALSWLAGFLVIFVPSGLGLREIVLTYLLGRSLGQSDEMAAAVAVLMRAHLVLAELVSVLIAVGINQITERSGEST